MSSPKLTKRKPSSPKPTKLTFGIGNAKLSIAIGTFSLPAGWTCPAANECFSRANRLTGKISDGTNCKYRCFAASQECVFPSVRRARWNNLELLKNARTLERMSDLIHRSISRELPAIRVHVSGDFWSETYFLAWVNVAINNPGIIFYGYTKMLPFLVKYKSARPPNFRFTASYGGKFDHLIEEHGLKYAKVVFSPKEAEELNLEIDHDDGHAIGDGGSFALLLHGTQPANTPAALALVKMRKENQFSGYSDSTKHTRMERALSKCVIKVTPDTPRQIKEQYDYVPKPSGWSLSTVIYTL